MVCRSTACVWDDSWASRAADSYVRTHASYTLLHWPNRRQEQYHSSSNTRRTLPSAGSLPRRGAHHLIIQPTYHPRVDSIDHATSALQERRITKSDTSLKPFLEQAVRSHSWLVSIFQASHSSNKHSQINTKSHQRVPSPYLALPNSSRSPSWPSNAICSRKSSSQRMREHIISRSCHHLAPTHTRSSKPRSATMLDCTVLETASAVYITLLPILPSACASSQPQLSAQPTTII